MLTKRVPPQWRQETKKLNHYLTRTTELIRYQNFNRFEINGSGGSIAFNLERLDELEVYAEDTRKGI